MPAKEDYEHLSTLADRLELDDDERDKFINSAMTRLGHKSREVWEEGDGDAESPQSGGDFFTTKRRDQRPTNRRKTEKKSWSMYGD